MKLFRCDHCGHTLYFENVVCEHCGHRLGYWHETNMLLSLEGGGDGSDAWTAPLLPEKTFVFCANAEFGAATGWSNGRPAVSLTAGPAATMNWFRRSTTRRTCSAGRSSNGPRSG